MKGLNFLTQTSYPKRNIFEHKFYHIWTKFWDSRLFLWWKYIVFDKASDVQVKSKQFRSRGAKNEEKLPPKMHVLFFFVLCVFL